MKHAIVAHHPLCETPYNKLYCVRASPQGTPLYEIFGVERPASAAPTALRAAFNRYGGRCFYCATALKTQGTQASMTIDHVVPHRGGGTKLLHNLVLSCKPCNQGKAAQPISDFRSAAGEAYISALERHIADAVRSAASS